MIATPIQIRNGPWMHNRGGGIYSKMLAHVYVCVRVRARFYTVGWTGGVRIACLGSGRGAKPPSQCQAEHHTDIGCSYTYYYLYSIIRCWFFFPARAFRYFKIKWIEIFILSYTYRLYYFTFFAITPVRRRCLFITVSFNTKFVIS